jgi:hypothetical protein
MSPGGGSPLESLDASRLPTLDGGGSTSTSVDWHPFNVSLIAMVVATPALVVLAMMPLDLDFPES